jgi:putative transport protein
MLSEVPSLHNVSLGVIISRVMHDGAQHVAMPNDVFHVGDVVLCNGPRQQLEELRDPLGVEAVMALHEIDSPLVSRDILVSQNKVFGKHIADLQHGLA